MVGSKGPFRARFCSAKSDHDSRVTTPRSNGDLPILSSSKAATTLSPRSEEGPAGAVHDQVQHLISLAAVAGDVARG